MSDPKAFVTAFVCVIVGTALGVTASYFSMDSPTKPYALKQNGDTLFIPTQVVVRRDTIYVIRTTDSVRIENSGYQKIYFDSTGLMRAVYDKKQVGTETVYDYPGEYIYPRIPKSKDTIYEHKIIYY